MSAFAWRPKLMPAEVVEELAMFNIPAIERESSVCSVWIYGCQRAGDFVVVNWSHNELYPGWGVRLYGRRPETLGFDTPLELVPIQLIDDFAVLAATIDQLRSMPV